MMIQRDGANFVGHFAEGDGGQFAFLSDDEAVFLSGHELFDGVVSEAGGEGAIEGGGGAAALDMAQDDGAAFEAGGLFDLVGEFVGDAAEADGIGGVLDGGFDGHFTAFLGGAFGDGDDAEAFAASGAFFDELADLVEFVGDFGDEDDVAAGGDAGVKSDPAGVSAHDFDDHDAMVAGGGGMDFIEGVGGGIDGGVEAEGDFGADQVVIDGFGDTHKGEAQFGEGGGATHGAVAADGDDGVETDFIGVLDAVFADVAHTGFAVESQGEF